MSLTPVSHDNSIPSLLTLQQGEVRQKASECTKRLVEWIREDRPAYQKVVIYTVVAIAAIALILSIVGIPFVAEATEECQRQKEASHLERLDRPIINIVGGPEAYRTLSVLDFSDRDASNQSSCPSPQDIPSPIMRGFDRYNRPVLFFKIYDKASRVIFVEMLYRKYSREEKINPWTRNFSERTIFNGDLTLNGNDIQRLRTVVNGTDRHFTLSRN